MKKIVIIVLTFLCFTCNSEDAIDCFQTAGQTIQEMVEVPSFQRILVNRDVELIITEAAEYTVMIETGKNLINDVKAEVIGDRLVLTDNNSCNLVRDYGITKVYVTAPNLLEIRSSSQFEIVSNGILNYSSLSLISEDFSGESEFTVGDFRLSVASGNLRIASNNLSFFYLEGAVENLVVNFFAGDGRFEGGNLIAQNVEVYHRGSNDMIVHPVQSLAGELRGTGDLIAMNEPPVVTMTRIYTGQLIFD